MTLTIKLDGNWNSFQLANNTPPLSVTGSVIAPSARISNMCTRFESVESRLNMPMLQIVFVAAATAYTTAPQQHVSALKLPFFDVADNASVSNRTLRTQVVYVHPSQEQYAGLTVTAFQAQCALPVPGCAGPALPVASLVDSTHHWRFIFAAAHPLMCHRIRQHNFDAVCSQQINSLQVLTLRTKARSIPYRTTAAEAQGGPIRAGQGNAQICVGNNTAHGRTSACTLTNGLLTPTACTIHAYTCDDCWQLPSSKLP